MSRSVPMLALAVGAFLTVGGLLPATGDQTWAASGGGSSPAPSARGRASAVRGSARRPALHPVRRTAPRRPGVPWMRGSLPNVQAQGALVIDLQDGDELFARNPDAPRPIASISKLAATLAVMDRGLPLEGITTISEVDLEVARGGARSRLLEGMSLNNRDLLHAALLGSDNRSVSALGRAAGMDAVTLAAEMTRKARQLGLTQTRFEDPTGLSPANQSTPREAIVLLRAVMDHPVLGPITRKLEHDVHPVGRPAIKYLNTHRLASRSNTVVLGGKTGFNNAARYCLVVAAEVGGRVLGMAFLGTEGELTRFGDVARVSDWVVAHRARSKQAGTAMAAASATSKEAAARSDRLRPDLSGLTPPPLTNLLPASAEDPTPRTSAEPPPPSASPSPWKSESP